MKQIVRYIKGYFYEVDKTIFMTLSLFTSVLVFVNYYYRLDAGINKEQQLAITFAYRYLIFVTAFAIPYLVCYIVKKKIKAPPAFIFLLLFAPALFAIKASLNFSFRADTSGYWSHTIYWPLHFIILISVLLILWKVFDNDQPFYGIKYKDVNWKPYLFMLLIMVPLIAAASTQADFLTMYPKIKTVTADASISWWKKILFELAYGSDFISIELFFRGFLILAFIKYAGKDAILPMACFYCTIHFGKPLAECISSYFGGIILGVVVYHTRSIFGGVIVHLGIAWMMELGGYIGNEFLYK